LNSGKRFVVPRYVGTAELLFDNAEFSAFGGGGGSRAVAERRGRIEENDRMMDEDVLGVVERSRGRGMRRRGGIVKMDSRLGVERSFRGWTTGKEICEDVRELSK
jgi:hypothetical protein